MSARDTHQRFEAAVRRVLKDHGLTPGNYDLNSVSKGGKITVTVKIGKGWGSSGLTKALDGLATSKGFELVRV